LRTDDAQAAVMPKRELSCSMIGRVRQAAGMLHGELSGKVMGTLRRARCVASRAQAAGMPCRQLKCTVMGAVRRCEVCCEWGTGSWDAAQAAG
jgi:hypothetical protein